MKMVQLLLLFGALIIISQHEEEVENETAENDDTLTCEEAFA